MNTNTPFDYVELGYMIGRYEVEGPYFDIDAACDKLKTMGLKLTYERIGEGYPYTADDIFDWIRDELQARSQEQPISTSEAIDQSPSRLPTDFLDLGLTVASNATNYKIIALKLESMGLLCEAIAKEDRIAMTGDQWLAHIEDQLCNKGLNVPFSSPESLSLAVIDIMSTLTPGIWSAMSNTAQSEYQDAQKLIRRGEFHSAAMHVCRAVEETFRSFFATWSPPPHNSNLSWAEMENTLISLAKATSNQQDSRLIAAATNSAKDFRINYRNPTMHVRRAEDAWTIRRLLSQSVEATTRLIEGMHPAI